MDDKIMLLKSTKHGYGTVRHRVLYFYAVNPRITDATGAEVVPQRSAGLDAEASSYLTTSERTAIDSGDAGFEILEREQTGGETNVAFRNRMQDDHASRKAGWVQDRRDQYALAGTSVSVA